MQREPCHSQQVRVRERNFQDIQNILTILLWTKVTGSVLCSNNKISRVILTLHAPRLSAIKPLFMQSWCSKCCRCIPLSLWNCIPSPLRLYWTVPPILGIFCSMLCRSQSVFHYFKRHMTDKVTRYNPTCWLFLWSLLKGVVYKNKPFIMNNLKENICLEIEAIPPDMLWHVFPNLEHYVQLHTDTGHDHFQHLKFTRCRFTSTDI